MKRMAEKRNLLDRMRETYNGPHSINGSKMAEKSLNRFKHNIIGK